MAQLAEIWGSDAGWCTA